LFLCSSCTSKDNELIAPKGSIIPALAILDIIISDTSFSEKGDLVGSMVLTQINGLCKLVSNRAKLVILDDVDIEDFTLQIVSQN